MALAHRKGLDKKPHMEYLKDLSNQYHLKIRKAEEEKSKKELEKIKECSFKPAVNKKICKNQNLFNHL